MEAISIKVATYNIRYDNPGDGEWSWGQRKQAVLQLIRFHDWDIFGVQEALPHQMEDLRSLPSYQSVGIAREDGQNLGEYNSIFFKIQRYELLDSDHFWLSATSDVPSLYPAAGCSRICVWVRLKDKTTQTEFVVAVTHLDNESQAAREFGSKLILEKLHLFPKGMPLIVMGDFNCEPDETTYQIWNQQLNDAKKVTQQPLYGPKGTFQEFNYLMSWADLVEIDYIFVNNGVTVEKVGTLTDNADQRFPSDHFPLETTIQLIK